MHPRFPIVPATLACVLACSPGTTSPTPEDPAFGGATFVLWPPPAGSVADSGDNPWLTGEALGRTGGAGGGPTQGETNTGSSGGQQPNLPPDAAATGGTSDARGAGGAEPITLEPARLIFRAYVESPSSFKALLIEHIAGAPAGACSVELYSNGSTEVWRSLDVPVGLTQAERALLCIPDGASPACTVGFGGSVYNGNDALVLRCDGRIEDTIGVVGVDPGKGWNSVGYDGQPITTVDQGLWRCASGGAGVDFEGAEWMRWDWASDAAWLGPECPDPNLGVAGGAG